MKWFNSLHEDDQDILVLIGFSSIAGTVMVLLIHGIGEVINAI